MACENTMYDWSAIYFEKAVNVPHDTATFGFVAYMIAMTTGRFVGDAAVNKYGVKPVLNYSGIFIFSGLILSVIFPYALTAGLGFVLVGLGVSCIVPTVFQIAGRSTKMSSGTALASMSTIGYLGFLMIPPLVGFVAEAASLRWSFGIVAALGIMIILLVRTVKD
jgi:MFS family permease